MREVPELTSSHEEADTRLVLHAKHAAGTHSHVIVISEDTDVFMMLPALEVEIGGHLLLRQGKKNQIRITDTSRLATIIGRDVCTALLGVHAWISCDSVSSFLARGRSKQLT